MAASSYSEKLLHRCVSYDSNDDTKTLWMKPSFIIVLFTPAYLLWHAKMSPLKMAFMIVC